MKRSIKSSGKYRFLAFISSAIHWNGRKFSSPSPAPLKHIFLATNGVPEASWVETRTSIGATSRILAKHTTMVYSSQPELILFANAKRNFEKTRNTPIFLLKVAGNAIFCLDRHYSSGVFLKGLKSTPTI